MRWPMPTWRIWMKLVGKKGFQGSVPIFLLPDPIQKVVDEPERDVVPRVELPFPLPEKKLLVDPLLLDLVPEEGDLLGGRKPAGLGIGSGFRFSRVFLPFRLGWRSINHEFRQIFKVLSKNIRRPDPDQDGGDEGPLLGHFLESVFDVIGIQAPVLAFEVVARPADPLRPNLPGRDVNEGALGVVLEVPLRQAVDLLPVGVVPLLPLDGVVQVLGRSRHKLRGEPEPLAEDFRPSLPEGRLPAAGDDPVVDVLPHHLPLNFEDLLSPSDEVFGGEFKLNGRLGGLF